MTSGLIAHFEQMPAAWNNVPRPNTLPPIERNRHVERNPVHPGGKANPLIERAKRSPELDDDFLRQAVPVARIPAIGTAHLIEDLPVLLQQRLKPLLF